jgi:hypothetical protein
MIQAGQFTYGAPGPFTMTYSAPINVSNASPVTFGAFDGYTLALSNSVISNGPLASSAGNVVANGALTGTNLIVNGGRLNTNAALNFSGGVTVTKNGTLRLNGNSYTGGNIGLAGTLEFNGNTSATLPLNVDGGRITVVSGVVNLGNGAINGTVPNANPTAGILSARAFSLVNPPGGFASDQGIATYLAATPSFSVNLANRDLNFGPVNQADGAYNAFFGGTTGDVFTAGFFGKFNTPTTGAYTFGSGLQDDEVALWVDINQNGVFERNGSSGDERIQGAGCCGGADPNATNNAVITLLGGQKYSVAFIVQDTGGGSSVAVKWDLGSIPGPGGLSKFVNPGDPAQVGFWSVEAPTGGARIEITAGSELKVGAVTNVTDAFLSGDGAKFTVGATPAAPTSIELLRNVIGTSTIEVLAGNTATINHITVTPNTTLNKMGAGTLISPGLSIGNGATFGVNEGQVIYTATLLATNGVANNGGVSIGGTGVFDLEGVLTGSVTVNSGGTFKGTGTSGPLIGTTDGIVAPGLTGAGTLSIMGDLLFLDGTVLKMDLGASAASDKLNVTGGVLLSNAPGTTLQLNLLPGFTAPIGTVFPLILNDGVDPVTGNFAGRLEGSTINIGNNAFTITYVANLDAGAIGNDVALTYTVPEPGAIAMLLGGFGVLLGAQRVRRKK